MAVLFAIGFVVGWIYNSAAFMETAGLGVLVALFALFDWRMLRGWTDDEFRPQPKRRQLKGDREYPNSSDEYQGLSRPKK
jgi:hypothetical protein